MKPALRQVVARLKSGVYPTVLEYGALLRENGEDQAAAQRMVSIYGQALETEQVPQGEARVLDALRSFSLAR